MSNTDKQNFLEKLQIVVAIMVTAFGAYTSFQATLASRTAMAIQKDLDDRAHELNKRAQELDREQKFSRAIQDQLQNISGGDPVKARIALASLYGLAREDSEKTLLFTISTVSGDDALTETISELIAQDPDVTDEFKEEIVLKLLQRTNKDDQVDDKDGSTDKSLSQRPDATPAIQARESLLAQLTQEEGGIAGWIYLGKSRLGSGVLENDKNISSSRIPSVGEVIIVSTVVNLRKLPANGVRLGEIVGVIGINTSLRVSNVNKVKIDASFEAIWAEVSYVSMDK